MKGPYFSLPALPSCTRRRQAVPGGAARIHPVPPSAHRVLAALYGCRSLDGGRHRNGFGQDGVLPLSAPRLLPGTGRSPRRETRWAQGNPRLSDERARDGPGAGRRDHPPHPVVAGSGERRTLLDHTRYGSVEDYVRAQHEVFSGESIEGDFDGDDWRLALARPSAST